jgi:hypothetical protein
MILKFFIDFGLNVFQNIKHFLIISYKLRVGGFLVVYLFFNLICEFLYFDASWRFRNRGIVMLIGHELLLFTLILLYVIR